MGLGKGAWRLALSGAEAESEFSCVTWQSQNFLKPSQSGMGLGKGAWRLALGGAEAESEFPA